MPAQWDKSRSYDVGEYVTYKEYDYVYINQNKKSTPGDAPDTATFTVPKYGEVIRAWTIWFSNWDNEVMQQYGDGQIISRGLPPGATPSHGSSPTQTPWPKFDGRPGIIPIPVKSDGAILGSFNMEYPQPLPEQKVVAEGFSPYQILSTRWSGYNVEFKSQIKSPDYWYNVTQASVHAWYLGGLETFSFIFQNIDGSEKVTLEASAKIRYLNHLSGSGNEPGSYLGIFNMFGRKFRFKYAVRFINKYTGKRSYTLPEYGEISTGEFRDNFASNPNKISIERTKPFPPEDHEGTFIFQGEGEDTWKGEFVLINND